MGLERWFTRVWHGCQCQTGWSENLRNCWRPRRARSTTSRRHRRNIAAALWVKMVVEVRAGCADWFEMTENAAVIQITTPYNRGMQKAPEHIKLGSFELRLVKKVDDTRSTFLFFCQVWWATINDAIFGSSQGQEQFSLYQQSINNNNSSVKTRQ